MEQQSGKGPASAPQATPAASAPSPKKKLVIVLLVVFTGWVGGHRYYAGKNGAIAMTLLGVAGTALNIGYGQWYGYPIVALVNLWALYDIIMVVLDKWVDKQGRPITNW